MVEVGAYRGELTLELTGWAAGVDAGARITAIDPQPMDDLRELAAGLPALELVNEVSLDALPRLAPADAVIIDGDHNYFTVSAELHLIAERAGERLPLIAMHDVCWPHARRDTYSDPDRIPTEHRQPLVANELLAPGEPGTADAGIRFPWAAAREGGARNGVLTAVEDFLAERDGLRFVLVPAFYGLGVIWPEDAHWDREIADLLRPWDRNPMLERLEAARLACIVDRFRLERQEALLRSLLDSRAFALAERISSVWQRRGPAFSRAQVRKALGRN